MIGKWGAWILTHISRIEARGVGAKFQAAPVTDAKAVKSVVEKFPEKYGARVLRSITQNLMWGS
ncbi:MAG: hypothetical protein DMG87_15105 [Acidobacteria bacterium]|nr:MAG: hypothetical protein DMG87_15105 [Acidobacteriota bacterium]